MIHGFVQSSAAFGKIATSIIFEKSKLSKSSENGSEIYILHHRYSSAILGNFNSKSILMIHMHNCKNVMCSCFRNANTFLTSNENNLQNYLLLHDKILRDEICSPFLILFISGSEMMLASSYDKYNFQCKSLGFGSYDIR